MILVYLSTNRNIHLPCVNEVLAEIYEVEIIKINKHKKI